LDEAWRVRGLTDETTDLTWWAVRIALAQRDYAGALRRLEAGKLPAVGNEERFWPISLLQAQIQTLAGQRDPARQSFETARVELEQKITQTPDDSRCHSSLGIAYAGLGRRVEAVREARLGCDLKPTSKDAMRALDRLEDLALVYAMVGQTSEAIAQLEELLQRSGQTTPHVLRLDPWWDPLRSDPRFQALLTKYEVKD
jgi:tetratricopeptide (TPR) repeat protein